MEFFVWADVYNGAAEGNGAISITGADWRQVDGCRRRSHTPSMCFSFKLKIRFQRKRILECQDSWVESNKERCGEKLTGTCGVWGRTFHRLTTLPQERLSLLFRSWVGETLRRPSLRHHTLLHVCSLFMYVSLSVSLFSCSDYNKVVIRVVKMWPEIKFGMLSLSHRDNFYVWFSLGHMIHWLL